MSGRVVFVTGSSTGIGEATALHFAHLGDTVYATMRAPDRSGGELRVAARGEELDVTLLALDVDDDHSVARAIGAAMERSGHIDVLVNNAGIGKLTSVEEVSMEDAKAVFETNVLGPLRTMQAVLPSMRERRSGAIVNITSISGRLVSGGHGIYSSSKYALEAMSEALAIETRKYGLRVIIIEPGFISTPILDKASKPLDADGPYAEVLSRMQAMYTHARAQADPPSVVAEAIAHALDDPEPKLRYVVGAGAEQTVLARDSASDELWIEQGGALTKEALQEWEAKVFPPRE
ncbi:MAG: SDR family oxidoreductase [Gemmatimonadetes bacterium]|nr:SDR family oxidoreductase [Gemmatimonadota bacterium]